MLLEFMLVSFCDNFGTVLGPFWVLKSVLEASWEHLGSLGSILGAPRDNLGACWAAWKHLGSILAASWHNSGCFLDALGASWEHLGTILDAFWERAVPGELQTESQIHFVVEEPKH